MFNFYLYNSSYVSADSKAIEDNLVALNDLAVKDKKENDAFMLHASLWDTQTVDGSFGEVVFSKMEDAQFSMLVLPRLFQMIDSTETEIFDFDDFDARYKIYNAFYGVNFNIPEMDRCITGKESYTQFRDQNIWEVTPASFWERRESLFQRIILCPSVENDLHKIGGTYLGQIISKLQELDKYIAGFWKEGAFNYVGANQKAALNISPESHKTMSQDKYKNQRMFSMPDGRRECFELHIKTGNLRFHFLPEGNMIYIGYIGKHLDTDRFN